MSGKDTQAPEKTPPTLSLRLAEASDDLDLLRPLIAEFHQASHFSGVPLSQAKIEAMFAEAVARPDRYAVIIAEYDRRAIGFLYCFAGEYVGGAGNDYFHGHDGDDHIYGNGGNDHIYGNDGDDHLYGGDGNDWLYGYDGNDRLYGIDGNDRLYGHDGDDHLYGGAGKDRLYGHTGDDHLYGHAGNDRLHGSGGDDTLLGGAGDDRLLGGGGKDILTGGEGRDLFSFASRNASESLSRADIITDFTAGVDVLNIQSARHIWFKKIDRDADGVNDSTVLYDAATNGKIHATLNGFTGDLTPADFDVPSHLGHSWDMPSTITEIT